ncbi:hypothetical protein BGZ63DRAFT_418290 [Mariannaea sp. PMI_226]|nr:hypothetical protein BGZ63DRAFT_418290 [Mariannaea sp. PMI_226]
MYYSKFILCEYNTPENPDGILIGCSNPTCGKWMHQKCLYNDVLMRIYNQLTCPPSSEGIVKEELQPISDDVQNDVRFQEATPAAPEARRKPRANKSSKGSTDFKPYVGLFEATLILDDGPTKWKICDLRDNILEGEKIWNEKVYCLLCGVIIE